MGSEMCIRDRNCADKLREINHDLADDIGASLAAHAELTWRSLQADHEVPGHAGLLDGKAIWEALEAVESTTRTNLSTDKADEMFEALKKTTPLLDGASPEAVADRFNHFVRDPSTPTCLRRRDRRASAAGSSTRCRRAVKLKNVRFQTVFAVS